MDNIDTTVETLKENVAPQEIAPPKDLSMEVLTKKEAHLATLVDKYKGLSINGPDDKEGYKAVDLARKDLKQEIVDFKKAGVVIRSEARAFASGIIKYVDDTLEDVVSLKESFDSMQDKIKEGKLKLRMEKDLPERKEKLKVIDVKISDDKILAMNKAEFNTFFQEKNIEYLQKQQEKLKEALANAQRANEIKEAEEVAAKKAKEKAEKDAEELAEKKAQEALEEQDRIKKKAEDEKEALRLKAIEDTERIKKEMEDEKQEAIDKIAQKAEDDKQKLIDEQMAKEEKRLSKENAEREKVEQEEKERQEAETKLTSQEKYINFLKENGCTNETKEDYYILSNDIQKILYKKIAIFELGDTKKSSLEIIELEKEIEYEEMQYQICLDSPTDTVQFRNGMKKHLNRIQEMKDKLKELEL